MAPAAALKSILFIYLFLIAFELQPKAAAELLWLESFRLAASRVFKNILSEGSCFRFNQFVWLNKFSQHSSTFSDKFFISYFWGDAKICNYKADDWLQTIDAVHCAMANIFPFPFSFFFGFSFHLVQSTKRQRTYFRAFRVFQYWFYLHFSLRF